MHSPWVFAVQTAVILVKNIFESCLIRLKGLNNKNSVKWRACSRGLVVKLSPGAWKGLSSHLGGTFFSSLLFFSFPLFFFFFFSFSFHSGYNSFVMFLFCYVFTIFDWQIFFSALIAVPPKSFARSCDLRISISVWWYDWAKILLRPNRPKPVQTGPSRLPKLRAQNIKMRR